MNAQMKGVNVAQTVNRAIDYVRSNPCCICSCEAFCGVKYKGTRKIRRRLRIALLVPVEHVSYILIHSIKTFIFVEDGSVDVDDLTKSVGNDVKVITYRQGASMPTIHQPQEPVRDCFDYQEQRIFKPTQAALNEVLSNCKISKKVRAILDNLYSDYFCD